MTFFCYFYGISDLRDRARQKYAVDINCPSLAPVTKWLKQIFHIGPLSLPTAMTFLPCFIFRLVFSDLEHFEYEQMAEITSPGNKEQNLKNRILISPLKVYLL